MKYVYACVREYIHMGERDRDNESSYVCVFNIHKTVGDHFHELPLSRILLKQEWCIDK